MSGPHSAPDVPDWVIAVEIRLALPILTGTRPQCAWARKIRAEKILDAEAHRATVDLAAWQRFTAAVPARHWIDRRQTIAVQLLLKARRLAAMPPADPP